MKTLKLVLGILCICLAFFIIFQSCAAGVGNALQENGESSGSAGIILTIMMVAASITMLATRNSEKKGGPIACTVLYLIGGILGFVNAGSFTDLKIWAVVCFILAVINILSIFIKKKPEENN